MDKKKNRLLYYVKKMKNYINYSSTKFPLKSVPYSTK